MAAMERTSPPSRFVSGCSFQFQLTVLCRPVTEGKMSRKKPDLATGLFVFNQLFAAIVPVGACQLVLVAGDGGRLASSSATQSQNSANGAKGQQAQGTRFGYRDRAAEIGDLQHARTKGRVLREHPKSNDVARVNGSREVARASGRVEGQSRKHAVDRESTVIPVQRIAARIIPVETDSTAGVSRNCVLCQCIQRRSIARTVQNQGSQVRRE